MFEPIREDLEISFTQAGILSGAAALSYAFAQVPAGYLSDRYVNAIRDSGTLFRGDVKNTNALYRWARTLSHARIAVVDMEGVYPLYGLDLDESTSPIELIRNVCVSEAAASTERVPAVMRGPACTITRSCALKL